MFFIVEQLMNPMGTFLEALTSRQARLFKTLTTPQRIQGYLDSVRYCDDDNYHCPLSVITKHVGCCFEGALFAAVVFRRLGRPSLIVEMTSENDDYHILAVYKQEGCWGAVAKSIFPGLRSRQPVYRTLRELVMSYFEFYYNLKGKRTLRGFSLPLDLKRLDGTQWMIDDEAISGVGTALDNTRHFTLAPARTFRRLPKMDRWTYTMGMFGTDRSKLEQ